MDKNNNNPPIPSDFFLYKNSNGEVKVEIYIFNETVWLPQDKIAQLFGVDRSIVTEHLKNVYKSGELSKGVTCAIFAQVESFSNSSQGRSQDRLSFTISTLSYP